MHHRELHQDVCRAIASGSFALQRTEPSGAGRDAKRKVPEPIAIVGMAGLFPGAAELGQYWVNIVARRDLIEEVPPERWPTELFYDPNPRPRTAYRVEVGRFRQPHASNPLAYGIPPTSLSSVEPIQLMLMEVARQAWPTRVRPAAVSAGKHGGHTGISERHFGSGTALHCPLSWSWKSTECRTSIPSVRERIIGHLRRTLPELTEDSFPGHFGQRGGRATGEPLRLGRAELTVDAACATSLAALAAGIQSCATARATWPWWGRRSRTDRHSLTLVQQDGRSFPAWALPPL